MRARFCLAAVLIAGCTAKESSPAPKDEPEDSAPSRGQESDDAAQPGADEDAAEDAKGEAKPEEPAVNIDELPLPPGIRRDRVQKDLDLLARFAKSFPLGSAAEVVAALDDSGKGCAPQGQGFGIETRTCAIGAGYASCRVSFVSFEGAIFDATALCRFNERRWSEYEAIGRKLFAATILPRGFRVDGRTAKLTHRDDAVHAKAVEAVAATLGAPPETSVAPELAEAFGRLTDPRYRITVGTYCGGAGAPPEGHQAMNALVEAKAEHLLRSALLGMNAGGRLYGYIGLKLLKKNTAKDDATYDQLVALDADIETCGGCMLGTAKAADVDLTGFGPRSE